MVRERPVFERGLAELSVIDPGDHDHGRVRPGRTKLLEQAVARLVRKAHVEQGDRVVVRLYEAASLGGAQGHVALEAPAPEGARHHPRERLVVVHDQDTFGGFGAGHGHAV